jgi:DNA-binding cell septation regulator SpoVG
MQAERLKVSDVKIRLVDRSEDGLIGWASCVVNGSLYLDNIAIRRNMEGEVIITFPARRSGSGEFYYFKPINRKAAGILTEVIIAKLKLASQNASV